MNPNKNTQTYSNKYIKTQNPINQEEKQTTKHKESLSYRINKQINIIKNNDFIERKATKRLQTNKKRISIEAKEEKQKKQKGKNINMRLSKYI